MQKFNKASVSKSFSSFCDHRRLREQATYGQTTLLVASLAITAVKEFIFADDAKLWVLHAFTCFTYFSVIYAQTFTSNYTKDFINRMVECCDISCESDSTCYIHVTYDRTQLPVSCPSTHYTYIFLMTTASMWTSSESCYMLLYEQASRQANVIKTNEMNSQI
uniref:Uncharacterized protein n=1 Tax=Glossina pallidipes TaxID=7398 RepID=A0A1B0A0Z3_GLOPL